MVDLHRLAGFHLVATEGGYARAARAAPYPITQPALHQQVKKLEADLKAAGVSTDFTIYPGVDHGFFNDTRKEVHDVAAATEAWSRVLAFLAKHLK